MKKIYSFIIISLLLTMFSCDKPKDFYEQLGKGAYLTLSKTNNLLLNAVDPNSSVSITVNSVGEPVESVNLYVAATNTTDKTKWKLIKNFPFSSEATLIATNSQIATALGLTPGALAPGSVFFLYNEVVLKDGRKFSTANTSALDLESQPAFNISSVWNATVVCPYNAATVAGTYTVVQDDWQDWTPGDMVQVTANGNTVDLSQVWPNPAAGGSVVSPLVINVDPSTGVVTVPIGVKFGHYTGSGGYDIVTVAGSSGFVFSCTNTINVKIHFTSPQFGDQGINQLILQK